jgi:hypothetical protein
MRNTAMALIGIGLLAPATFGKPFVLTDEQDSQITAGTLQFSLGFADGGRLATLLENGRLHITGTTRQLPSITVAINGTEDTLNGPSFDFHANLPSSITSLLVKGDSAHPAIRNAAPTTAIITLNGINHGQMLLSGASGSNFTFTNSGGPINGLTIVQGSTVINSTIKK